MDEDGSLLKPDLMVGDTIAELDSLIAMGMIEPLKQ